MPLDVCRSHESGASAVEYGLIVFAVAAVIAVIVFSFGVTVVELFSDSCQAIDGKAGSGSAC